MSAVMCMWMYVCEYYSTCMYDCVFLSACVYAWYTRACMYLSTHVHHFVCVSACMYALYVYVSSTYVYVCLRVCIYIVLYAHETVGINVHQRYERWACV